MTCLSNASRRRALRWVSPALTLVSLLVLSGCGAQFQSGQVIEFTRGYQATVPSGWSGQAESYPNFSKSETRMVTLSGPDSQSSSINPMPEGPARKWLSAEQAELDKSGVGRHGKTTIDGVDADVTVTTQKDAPGKYRLSVYLWGPSGPMVLQFSGNSKIDAAVDQGASIDDLVRIALGEIAFRKPSE